MEVKEPGDEIDEDFVPTTCNLGLPTYNNSNTDFDIMINFSGRTKVITCNPQDTINDLVNYLLTQEMIPHDHKLSHNRSFINDRSKLVSTLDSLIPVRISLEIKGGSSNHPGSLNELKDDPDNVPIVRPNNLPPICKIGHSTPSSSSCRANNRVPLKTISQPHPALPYDVECMHSLETNINLNPDWNPIEFLEDEDQNKQRFLDNWSRGITYSISYSPDNVIRLVTQMQDNKIIIRYITPFHIWTVLFIDNVSHWEEPQNTTVQQIHNMRKWWAQSIHMSDQAETKFIIHRLITDNYTTPPTKLSTIIFDANEDGCSLRGSCFPCPHCKTPDSAHSQKWSISSLFGSLSTSCKAQVRPTTRRISETDKSFLFLKPKPPIKSLSSPKPIKGSNPITGFRTHKQPSHTYHQLEEGPHRNNINILQWNMDKRGNQTLREALTLADKQHADIVCLQETENLDWVTSAKLISEYGYNTILHGKVATLTNIKSIDHRIINTWFQDDRTPVPPDTICVTILTPLGEILILNTYIQNGVDHMAINGDPIKRVELHHEMMYNLSTEYHHTIICMDGNETLPK
jgi:hypothetical protein